MSEAIVEEVGIGEISGTLPELIDIQARVKATRVVVQVLDKDTKEPVKDAIVTGRKFLVPIIPRRTNEKGMVIISTRFRSITFYVYKENYKLLKAHVVVPIRLGPQKVTLYLKKK